MKITERGPFEHPKSCPCRLCHDENGKKQPVFIIDVSFDETEIALTTPEQRRAMILRAQYDYLNQPKGEKLA